ncbi:hypothetical protein H4W79_000271 [Nocardiopsis terrae]|uniref:Sensor n=1 Tax=Nocardiopsis terrae TaxID=372655 RepID=A0ABR9HAK0_9ACTN|nr:hypothetical protein [Nocardiopsis terrae]MBE1456057.1 hypothetical protein [Nocardiopsis terrae]
MNEQTTHPRSAHRHPRALFGRMQVYAQNNPRPYAVRALLVLLSLAVLPPLVLSVILFDDWSVLMPVLVGAAVPVVVMGVLMVLLMPWFIRRTLGAWTLPPDTEPGHLLEAKRQLRRGGLHGDEDVNRIARVVAAQAEIKINSPRTINVLGLVAALLFGSLTALTYRLSGPGLDFWFQAGITLVFLSYPLLLGPWAKRYRQRARDFAKLYDARRQKD